MSVEPRIRVEVLNRENLQRIDLASIQILERVGVKIYHDRCLKLLDEAGADVDYGKKQVWMPEYLVREALQSTPSRFTLYPRDPRFNVRMEGRRVHFGVGAPGVTQILDIETGKPRPPTSEDAKNLARLVDAVENFYTYNSIVTPTEVNPLVQDLHRWAIVFNHLEKAVFDGGSGKVKAEAFLAMASAIAGGIEELKKKPLVMGFGCPTSPLQHPQESLDWLIAFAERGIPYAIISEPIAGVSGPVTLAGSLAQMNAEILSEIVIAQLIRRGTPLLYAANPFPMDMKTGNVALGAPEVGLMAAISTQLAQYYGVPSETVCAQDGKVIDAQYGFDRSMAILPALAGSNLIGGGAILDAGNMASYEAVVLGNEFAGLVYRILRGAWMDDESLALDPIQKIGAGGNFLAHPHTLRHAMKEIWYPSLIDRWGRSAWEERGSKTILEKAREKVKRTLKEHEPTPLDKDVQEKISQILKETEKRVLRLGDTGI
jgi:trimethylamine--corrinoid protein Co-methyltransferase